MERLRGGGSLPLSLPLVFSSQINTFLCFLPLHLTVDGWESLDNMILILLAANLEFNNNNTHRSLNTYCALGTVLHTLLLLIFYI